jgi:RND family efflux transporter MFP subunit
MKRYLKIFLVIIVFLGLAAAAIRLVGTRRAELEGLAQPEHPAYAVYMETVQAGELAITRQFIGTIEPVEHAVAAFRVEGHLVEAPRDEGDHVAEGEIIARIDERRFSSQQAALQAEREGARSELSQAKSRFERRRTLFEKDLIDQEAMDAAESAFEVAQARVETLEARLASAKADLAYTTLDAPFDGVITARYKQAGDLAMPGEPVYRLENPGAGYKVIFHVPRETTIVASPGARTILTFDSRMIEAPLHRVYPSTREGRLSAAEIRVDSRPFGLTSGSLVSVDLLVEQAAGMLVSAASILEDEAGARVFRVDADNRIEIIEITVMGRKGDSAVIAGPILPGDRLVTAEESMLLHLSHQSRVRPQTRPQTRPKAGPYPGPADDAGVRDGAR